MDSMVVKCYARGFPGRWEAICVDFDIAVQGRSFEDVKRLLEGAVKTYIEDACAEEPRVARRLLGRKSPLSLRLRLMLAHWFNQTIARRADDQKFQAGFDLHCHA